MDKIQNALIKAGVPTSLNGFKLLHDAISIVQGDKSKLNGATKNLYPEVAAMNGVYAYEAERNMRYAVRVGFKRMPDDRRARLFGFSKPGTKSFIASILMDMEGSKA